MKYLSLKDHVYKHISEQISQGHLKPDEKIKENIICEALKVSRTPVREALIELTSDGVLEFMPRKGFVVKKMNIEEAAEIYMIIGVLDGYAARLACPIMSEETINNMDLYIDYMDLAIEKGNADMYYKHQEDFHLFYINICGNSILKDQLDQLKRKFLRKSYVVGDGQSNKDILFKTNEEHREIVKMFREKRIDELEIYIRETHWNASHAYLESM